MQTDARNLEVSGAGAEALAAVDDFRNELVAARPGMEAVLEAADRHPDCALLQIYAAMLHLYAQDHAGRSAARGLLDRAQGLRAGTTDREALFLDATEAWWAGDPEAGADRFEALTQRWPRDLVAVKACEFLYYVMGQHWSAARFLSHLERISRANADSGSFLGIWSFAAELSGHRERAIELAARALELAPADAWTHHALCHVYLMEGRAEEGRRMMRPHLEGWSRAVSSIQIHNTWHLALFDVVLLNPEPVLDLYHEHVASGESFGIGALIDAIALLWWLENAGFSQDDVWPALVPHLLPYVRDLEMPFVAAHFATALARGGEDEALEALLADVRGRASQQSGERRRAWQVGSSLVEACAALGRGDARAGCEWLEPVIGEVGRVGGSDAQDAVFRYALVNALSAAGRSADALERVRALAAGREVLPFEARWL